MVTVLLKMNCTDGLKSIIRKSTHLKNKDRFANVNKEEIFKVLIGIGGATTTGPAETCGC